MTLEEWKGLKSWNTVSIDITSYLSEPLYLNRLNRLRSGKSTPTSDEIKALLTLTNNEVDSYR